MMKVILLILIIGGVERPPVELSSMEQCMAMAASLVRVYQATGAEETIMARCVTRPAAT